MKSLRSYLIAVLSLLVTGACSDHPGNLAPDVGPEVDLLRSYNMACAQQKVADVPAIQVELSDKTYPWERNDSLLIEAVRAADGIAIVAFKEPESARLTNTRTVKMVGDREVAFGTRAAVSGASICAGLDLLDDLGAGLVHYYEYIGAAAVRIKPDVAPRLRDDPLVDYLVPEQVYSLQG